MSQKVAALVIGLALAAAGIAWMLWAPASVDEAPTEAAAETPAVVATPEQPLLPASIYRPGADALLHGSMIQIPAEDGEARIRSLVEALLDPSLGGTQPVDEDLVLTLPEGTRLAGVFFLAPRSVALDLRLPESVTLRGFGSKDEILSVYSLVNSVALNSDRVDEVVIMVDGRQPETLAGHVDLTRPLRADPTLIAASASDS